MSGYKKRLMIAAAALAAQTLTLANASAESACFVLRELDGRIALFAENDEEPLAVYKTPLDSLFPADAEMLRNGIRIQSSSEVSCIINDLGLE